MADSPLVLAHLRNARKSYGKLLALDDMDLQLRSGQVLALLGANGAGKSTAVSVMLGLVQAEQGEASLLGQPPLSMDARRRTGVMLQSTALPDTLKVGELLAMTRGYYAQPLSVADCVAMAGLEGLLDRRYGKLSGGQQRRVQFAMAICGRPQVLFLDEPTTGLDPKSRRMIWNHIRKLREEQTMTIFLTTHYMEETEEADTICIIEAGKIVATGSPAELRAAYSHSYLTITAHSVEPVKQKASRINPIAADSAIVEGQTIRFSIDDAAQARLILAELGDDVLDFEFRHGRMDDVFLALTGSQLEVAE